MSTERVQDAPATLRDVFAPSCSAHVLGNGVELLGIIIIIIIIRDGIVLLGLLRQGAYPDHRRR